MSKRILMGIFLIVGCAILLGFAPAAKAFEIGARAYYWYPALNADVRVDMDLIPGTDIDLDGDLGIGDEGIPSVEAFLGTDRHHLSLMYSAVDYDGTSTIGRDITFMGKKYAANAVVNSDFKLWMLDLEYQIDLLNMENILAGFSLGVIGKIKYIDAEVKLVSNTAGSVHNLTEDVSIPIPMVGVGAHIGLLANILEARAKVTGIGYSGSMFYDAMADISFTPFPFLDIHGGYRIMKLEIDDISDVYGEIEFSGPYVALTVGF
ncbi:MAG: hypothetical protein JW950_12690 [Deltaproteobacteria bacterium]|nr:hypothetical protein [Deltaproteobacteria bacterium]